MTKGDLGVRSQTEKDKETDTCVKGRDRGGTEVAHLCRRLSFLFEQLRPGCSMLKLIFHSDRKINTKFSLKNALLKVTEKSNREN